MALGSVFSPYGIFQVLMNLPTMFGAIKSWKDSADWKKKWGAATDPANYLKTGWSIPEGQRDEIASMPSHVDTGIRQFLYGADQNDIRNALK